MLDAEKTTAEFVFTGLMTSLHERAQHGNPPLKDSQVHLLHLVLDSH